MSSNEKFLSNTSIIRYSKDFYERNTFDSLDKVRFNPEEGQVEWINTYGLDHSLEFREVILQNKLDDFLLKLFLDLDHPNKVINLGELLFISIRVLKTENQDLGNEQMLFICSDNFIWSIQEKHGDYFGWIRERIENGKGMVRRKRGDYLLFLLMESIIDNYQNTYNQFADFNSNKIELEQVRPTPEFTAKIEGQKQQLFAFKKASVSLRDTMLRLETTERDNFEFKYFTELKEQINYLIVDIDFELQEMESRLNLIFSIQGHRLNEVMKTLTIFSVVFIPLTFIAGIYGMNFTNMPELQFEYGYFVVLAAMLVITVIIVLFIIRKRWF